MNYLQLAQELARKAGVSGTPSAVEGQVGESLRLVNWVKQAWIDIQSSSRDWSFMWAESTAATTVAGTAQYVLPVNCRSVMKETMVLNGSYLSYIELAEFRARYRLLSETGVPGVYTVSPDRSKVEVYPVPDAAYSYQFDYYKIPTVLAASTDTPALAAHYHQAIVWLALKYYGEYEQDADVVSVGNAEYNKMLTAICNEFIPDLKVGEALV
jgi:hypothetical protein